MCVCVCVVQLVQALRYETPEFLEHEEEEEEEEEEGQEEEDKKDLSLEATYSEGEAVPLVTLLTIPLKAK